MSSSRRSRTLIRVGPVLLTLAAASMSALLALSSTVASASGPAAAANEVRTIDISQPLTPGVSYRLPTLEVTNPGTATAEYRVVVRRIAGGHAPGPPPDGWFDLEPSRLSLQAGERRAVAVRLAIPLDAAPGRYSAAITVSGGSDSDAATAMQVTFAVDAGVRSRLDGIAGVATSTAVPVGVLAAGVALYGLWRLRPVRLRIERRRWP
jgi:hypothetical protein